MSQNTPDDLTGLAARESQPKPTPNDRPAILPLVIADLNWRGRVGLETYGTPLQPFNGRDALEDAYAEALNMCMYMKQAIIERDRLRFGPERAERDSVYEAMKRALKTLSMACELYAGQSQVIDEGLAHAAAALAARYGQ